MEQIASPPFSQAARSFFVFMAEAYNKSRRPPTETAHNTKRCSSFAKICELRGPERRDFPENPGRH
jgi:hypothetical protein